MELSTIVVLLAVALAFFAAASFESLLKGGFELRRGLRSTTFDFGSVLLKSPLVPGVSVIYRAPDASAASRAIVRRLLDLHFGKHEIVLVLDAPGVEELGCWVEEFHLHRQERVVREVRATSAIRSCYVSSDPIRLLVVDKERGGMGDAMNAGVNHSQFPVIGLLDGEADFIP